MSHSETNSSMSFFTDIQERHKPVAYLLYLLRVLFIGIFQFFKSTGRIYIVTRIDTYLLRIQSSYIGYSRIEMNISYQRDHISLTSQADIDIHQILGFFNTLRSQADILTAGINNSFSLFHTSLRIHRGCICHRLDTNRIGTAQRNGPNIYFRCFPSGVIE